MKISNRVFLSAAIIVMPVILWIILSYTQERIILGSLAVQIFIWLGIAIIQGYIATKLSKFRKLVPIIGVIVALAMTAYSWVGARLLGLL